MAIKTNGTLWAWGYNHYRQLGNGTNINSSTPVQIGTESDWASVSAGSAHTLAIKTNGTLWGWGYNFFGLLGDGTTIDKHTPVQIGTENWASIFAGNDHTLGIRADGTLWAWGENDNSQLGDGTTTDKISPGQIGIDSDWASITAGDKHSMAIKTNGTLWGWGGNTTGQLGDGTTTNKIFPVQIESASTWASVAAGGRLTLAIKSDGTLWSWGYDFYARLGNGGNVSRPNPSQIGVETDWAFISAGSEYVQMKRADGTLWALGWNGNGQLGDGATISIATPEILGSATDWALVSAGNNHALAIKVDGTLWGWGENFYGQLGDGTDINRTPPVQIGSANDWAFVFAGYAHSLAIKTDGTLWAWGSNTYGQLGNGTTTSSKVPVKIGDEKNWVSVSAGYGHTLAIKTDGTIWSWGWNADGRLGDGTFASKHVPVQIGNDIDWASISAGRSHNLAIKTDGTLWAWGDNIFGQLGDGTTEDKNSPVKLGSDADWASVSAAYNHNLARKTDGTIWGWGGNYQGQIGDGTTTSRRFPVKLSEDTDWAFISAFGFHSQAIKTNGTLWGWGNNLFGNVGDGTATDKYSPTLISNATNWSSVSAGNGFTMAIKTILPPATPAKPMLAGTSDTGASNSDGITSEDKPEFYGTAKENSLVTIYINEAVAATTTADAVGNWSYALLEANALPNGTYHVKVTATNSEGNESAKSAALVIIVDQQFPTIRTKNISIELDGTGNAVITYQDVDNGTTDNSTSTANLSFSLNRTAFACADKGQSLEVTLSVTDEAGNIGTGIATVTIADNMAPVIEAGQVWRIDENSPSASIVGSVRASDNCAIQAYAISSGNTGDAFAIDATGSLTVNNAAVLDFEISQEFILTVTVVDGSGNSSSRTITVSLNNLNDNAPAVAANQSFSIDENSANGTSVGTVQASDADGGTTYSNWMIISGNTGNAFTINPATGVISIADGTALDYQTTPTYNLEISVSDGVHTSAGVQVLVNLNEVVNNAPVLAAFPDMNGNEKELISFTASASDDDSEELHFNLGEGAPAGASINATTGVFSWTPTEEQGPASYTIKVIVSDGALTDAGEVKIVVNEVNQAPVFTSEPVVVAREGEVYSYQITATDADLPANILTYEALEIPSWLSFDASTQTLSGTPDKTAEESSLIHLQLSDGQEIITQEFTIAVEITTGLFDRKKPDGYVVLVYPNPTHGSIMVEWAGTESSEIVTVSLSTLEGKLLLKENGTLMKSAENISTYLQETEQGVYLLELRTKERINTIKIVKE